MASGDMETIEVDTNMAMNMNNSKEIATYREIGDTAEIEGILHIFEVNLELTSQGGNTF